MLEVVFKLFVVYACIGWFLMTIDFKRIYRTDNKGFWEVWVPAVGFMAIMYAFAWPFIRIREV